MIIYKYSSIWKAISNLKIGGVALSSPRYDFNDPYDCNVSISDENRKQAFKLIKDLEKFNYYLNAVGNGQICLSKKLKNNLSVNYHNYIKKLRITGKVTIEPFMLSLIAMCSRKIKFNSQITKEKFEKDIDSIFPDIIKNALVSCFSKRNDSVVMWAHYASNHKGVCIEYEVDNPRFYEVVYDKKLPKFDLTDAISIVLAENILKIPLLNDELSRKLNEPFYKKSTDWSYEEEVRCVYNAKRLEDGIYPNAFINRYVLPFNNVKAIYLGICCDLKSNDVKNLLYMANMRGIPVYKTKASKECYSIEIDELLDVSDYKKPVKTNYSNSVDFLLNQISKSVNNGEMLDGLFISLFAITHCSNLFDGDPKERFVAFYNDYVLWALGNDVSLPAGDVIFEMKERLFSHGDTDIASLKDNMNVTELKIDLSEPYELLNISISGKTVEKSGNTRLNMSAFAFCECVKKALLLFEKDYKSSLTNLPKLNFYNNREDMFDLSERINALGKV